MNGVIIPAKDEEIVEYSNAFTLKRIGKQIILTFNGEAVSGRLVGYTLPVKYRPASYTKYNMVLAVSGNTNKLAYMAVDPSSGYISVYPVNSDYSVDTNFSGSVFGEVVYYTE